jgi:uncharacterized coiled-coil protein SlyX
MTDENRFESLEIKIAHLEKAVQELSDVIHRQQQQIDRLSAASQQLMQQLAVVDSRMNPEGL